MRIWPILGPKIWGIVALICVQKLDLTPKNRDLATFFFPGFLEILDLFKGRKTIKMGKHGVFQAFFASFWSIFAKFMIFQAQNSRVQGLTFPKKCGHGPKSSILGIFSDSGLEFWSKYVDKRPNTTNFQLFGIIFGPKQRILGSKWSIWALVKTQKSKFWPIMGNFVSKKLGKVILSKIPGKSVLEIINQ